MENKKEREPEDRTKREQKKKPIYRKPELLRPEEQVKWVHGTTCSLVV